jgi:hypothetical protein
VESLELTFRFDNEANSLTRFNGLPIDVFANFLKSLSEAVGIKNSTDLVVSEIKGNCYAPVISTNSVTKYAEIKVLHEAISNNSYSNLTAKQISYAKSLKHILGNKYYLDVYDLDKSYFKKIKEINIVERVKHYYESTSIRGTVTRIGGKTLDSKPRILISKYEKDIEITDAQDEALKAYYKTGMLELYLVQKVNSETNQIESALLENFIVLKSSNDSMSFLDVVSDLRIQYGNKISDYLNTQHD